jgi:hypothetical protein
VPPAQVREHGGRKPPLSLSPREMMMRMRVMMRRKGISPRPMTSLANRRGSSLVPARQNILGCMPGECPTCCHSPTVTLVTSDLQGLHVCIGGAWITHLLGIL